MDAGLLHPTCQKLRVLPYWIITIDWRPCFYVLDSMASNLTRRVVAELRIVSTATGVIKRNGQSTG